VTALVFATLTLITLIIGPWRIAVAGWTIATLGTDVETAVHRDPRRRSCGAQRPALRRVRARETLHPGFLRGCRPSCSS